MIYSFVGAASLILGFRFLHDLDVEGSTRMPTLLPSLGLVEWGNPFASGDVDAHFVMDAFENEVRNGAFTMPFFICQIHVFRTDDDVDRLVRAEALVDTGEGMPSIIISSSCTITAGKRLLSPIKSAMKAFSGSL